MNSLEVDEEKVRTRGERRNLLINGAASPLLCGSGLDGRKDSREERDEEEEEHERGGE